MLVLVLAIDLKVSLAPMLLLVLEVNPEVALYLVVVLGVLPLPTAND